MSKLSNEKFKLKNEYFDYLKDTALKVDPYVKYSISHFSDTDLEKVLISRYRFGKPQLRPAQVRLSYELFGGDNWEKIIPACASVEVKDTGYYCLDEFFDKTPNKELALLQGIFSSLSYSMIFDLADSFNYDQINQVLCELTNLDLKNAKAAAIEKKLKQPNEKLYFKKVEGYNFWETPLRIGAILANAPQKDINLIGESGKQIGMGYIIANDTWDFGKELEDFRSGKYTLPIAHLFENINADSKKKLSELFGKPKLSKEEEDFIRLNCVHTGTIEYGKKLAQSYCDKGLELLNLLGGGKAKRLLQFATTMTQKNAFYDSLKKFEIPEP